MSTRPILTAPPKDYADDAGTVARNVVALREMFEISQERLANLSGLSRDTIRSVEEGRTDLRLSSLAAVAQPFGLSARDLLSEDAASRVSLQGRSSRLKAVDAPRVGKAHPAAPRRAPGQGRVFVQEA